MKKKIKVKCISTDSMHLDGYFTQGKSYRLTRLDGNKYYTVKADRDVELGVVQSVVSRNKYYVAGFENCVFEAPKRFEKRNQSAAWGQLEIDVTRCKRSIRNQARNIAKEHFSCGKLEKIARGYKR